MSTWCLRLLLRGEFACCFAPQLCIPNNKGAHSGRKRIKPNPSFSPFSRCTPCTQSLSNPSWMSHKHTLLILLCWLSPMTSPKLVIVLKCSRLLDDGMVWVLQNCFLYDQMIVSGVWCFNASCFSQAAKLANYAKYQRLCDAFFMLFGVVFIVTRLGIYPFW